MSQTRPHLPAGATLKLGRWTVHEFPEVDSTNLAALKLPAWSAVRADTQTGGRGRFDRTWISDRGGLWLSAVVPLPGEPWGRMLPLLAGLAVCEALRRCGARDLRMRWPNDVLVGNLKLAGLLIDQFVPDLAVAGIGINVSNRPQEIDPLLVGQVARLADLVTPVPPLPGLTERVLRSLENVLAQANSLGPESLLPDINALWQGPRSVQIDLEREVISGKFEGVDGAGRLCLRCGGREQFFDAHQVRLLRDLI